MVKAWLTYLLQTPLYKAYCVTLNKDFLQDESTENNNTHTDDDDEADDTVMDVLEPNSEYENEVLLAKQKTLMWSEEQYLTLAPGMNQTPTNIIFDEYAEELSFPAIYLGHPLTFNPSVHVTPYLMATSEIPRSDRRGVTPERILNMATKIMRMQLNRDLTLTFKTMRDTVGITREMIEDKQKIDQFVHKDAAFLKSIPNSVTYWHQRKNDLFAMIR